jgi:hypothetical protein
VRRLHVAHRACLVAAEWSRGQANAFLLTMASQTIASNFAANFAAC